MQNCKQLNFKQKLKLQTYKRTNDSGYAEKYRLHGRVVNDYVDKNGIVIDMTKYKGDEMMWELWKRCPFLCCVISLFFLLCIIGWNKGDGLKKEDLVAYVDTPLWERAFDVTLIKSSQTENACLGNNISEKETPMPSAAVQCEQKAVTVKVSTPSSLCTDVPSKKGITRFETYVPKNINSPYYSDPGMTALTTDYEYQRVDNSYFEDAAFIGDSRMLGIYDYTSLKEQADFFCESGFSLFQWTRGAKVTWKNKNKKVDLENIMKNNSYKKVYITIGMNDLGYGNEKNHGEWMKQLIHMIQKNQKDVIIYLIGNLHMSKSRNNPDTEFNNVNVNARNVETAKLADGEHIFYLDINPLYTDKDGFLQEDISADGCHVYGYCYEEIEKFLKKHAVVLK